MEPQILKRGKEFHKKVQIDWQNSAKNGDVFLEHTISLSYLKKVGKTGRVDIFINDIADFVSVVEIKSTIWDEIKEKNYQKLLSSHRRQVWKYINKYIDVDHIDICPGIIYPVAPLTSGLKSKIENYLNDYGLQVVWYYG